LNDEKNEAESLVMEAWNEVVKEIEADNETNPEKAGDVSETWRKFWSEGDLVHRIVEIIKSKLAEKGNDSIKIHVQSYINKGYFANKVEKDAEGIIDCYKELTISHQGKGLKTKVSPDIILLKEKGNDREFLAFVEIKYILGVGYSRMDSIEKDFEKLRCYSRQGIVAIGLLSFNPVIYAKTERGSKSEIKTYSMKKHELKEKITALKKEYKEIKYYDFYPSFLD
jgi:hypothetical protein